ncbi:bifunctional helix-turn-helix transcriptional regulator/GNAT family N-acetyltransferase [Niabella beijingensis]|uniref:bifunctional helix-turn-helix transcriptional regulator/GNAT family N-acetyltransferase n=1 Tax=Niabella beijingensis TaxID=2872700 RepID=UPI001CC014F0|nr:bifunctional helix-turn-helix transcriptional regulator/GNAT family N-acetyltransferase [Niabella beijingensis]MBZ4187319.1 bifunctional helix-turn-helix transcriptional regulator/GNAT family N-acetyltransferase [Niabella beijingensis]
MEKEFYRLTGKMALGSRLRVLAAVFTEDAEKIYEQNRIPLKAKWFPVFYMLSNKEEKTITEIAQEIGHSQPSVSRIVREMTAKGLITENKKAGDRRQTIVALSAKGNSLIPQVLDQCTDVNSAVEVLAGEAVHDLWEAIEEWEFLLEQKSLSRRVLEQKKLRESGQVRIVDYEPKYKTVFRKLNEAWISQHFEMETADVRALTHPEKYILGKGGTILVALYNNEPVGVCALIKMYDPDYDYEMAKMAVSPAAQGKNIGKLLADAIIGKAKKAGASKLYLESNTRLKPAISLYYKLGFKKITNRPSPYKRANIQMELDLRSL